MPSPPSLHQRQNNNKSTPSHANANIQSQASSSSPAFATFHANTQQLPSLQQFPSNSIQTNLLLNSLLLRHLQLNSQQNAQLSSSTQSMLPKMFWPNNNFFSPSSQQSSQLQQSQPTLTGPLAASSTAMFAKTIDLLYNFLSPNVILLPVACHSIPDEQHIQLLGMPQTIIPVSLHPNMLHQFPVRPLLVEPSLTTKMSASNQVPILMAHSMTKDDRTNHQQFHLPISFRQSFFSSSSSSNQSTIPPFSTGNSRLTMAGMPMEHCSERERTPPPQENHSKSIGKMDEMLAEDASNPIEPLDLSMATAACSDSTSSTLTATNSNNKQSRKRATEKKENEQQQQMQRKRIKSDEVQENNLSSLHTIMASTASNGIGIIQGLRTVAGALASIPLKMNAYVSSTDEKPKKRFPCDLCGDVSFLALETLEGHQKYYCRNRPRPDLPTEASKPIANGKSSSSNNPIVPPPTLLQWQHSEQLANSHERQVNPHSFVCAICGYKAFTIRGLRTHIRISHDRQKQNPTKMNSQKIEKDGKEEMGENGEKNLNEIRKSALVEIKLEKIN